MPNAVTDGSRRDTFRIAKHIRNVPGARARVGKSLADWGVSGGLADDVILAAGELVSNAIKHCGVTFAQIEISVSVQGQEIVLEVTDPDGDRIPRLRIADIDAEGGRGLFVIEQLANAWGHTPRRCGKCVWARFGIAGKPSPASADPWRT
ncbi:ATP-binding protein [Streptomyces hygroscopicus]|uniref:ATP-binding protein n=1 Tax=Streptomyces hygroscopicus TaxID=1912 RepID=A0ABQ3U517_STRHY|nr:ATP-binding protein [Streptomyces hygroscopicus]GHJ30708.1 ATP-binding protein [Streptomyces hygroscopicus]